MGSNQAEKLTDYIQAYLNDAQIKEQVFRIGREGFVSKGRGVVVIDLRRFAEHLVCFYYLSAGKDGRWDDGEMEQVCQSYNPHQEVIVFLFYGEFSPQNDCYKIAMQLE